MRIYIPIEIQRQIREQFSNCCSYCRTAEFLTATTFEFEHIVPRVAGGGTTLDNLCLACPMCNRFKSDRETAMDPVNQTEVPLFHPQHNNWVEHFVWNNGCTEIVGLTPTGRATVSLLKMNRSQLVRVRKMWVEMEEHPPLIG